MSLSYNTSITRRNLVVHFDAANQKCVTGSNTYLNMINQNNFSIAGAPSQTTNFKGGLVMDGTDDYLSYSVPTTTSRSVIMFFRVLTPGGGPLWRTNDWRERIFGGNVTLINSNVTYYSGPSYPSDDSIKCVAYSYNGTNAKFYYNGELTSSITMDGVMDTGTFTYRFGNQSSGSSNYFVNCEIFTLQFYDTQLTDAEMKQNFNAYRGRYGI